MSTADMGQNLNNLMKEAQKMQQRMQEAQAQLLKLVVSGESGGGKVKVTMNGSHQVISIVIHPSLLDDVDMLEPLIVAAFNSAVQKVEASSKDKINELTAGLNIPTDFMNKGDE